MPATMDAVGWLQLIGLGGGMGLLGQGVRMIVGLKKLSDMASGSAVGTGDLINGQRLLVSLAIGFIAGAIAALALIDNLAQVSTQQLFMLMAAGYSGADFIEGFMARASGAATTAAAQVAAGSTAADAGAPADLTPASDGAVG